MLTRPRTRVAAVAAAAVLAAGAGLALAPAASAGGFNNNCDHGPDGAGITLYYNSNEQGAAAIFCNDIPNYAGYTFYYGAGAGRPVKNDAASVENQSVYNYTIFYDSGYQGPSQTIYGRDSANLDARLKNNNASQKIDN